MASGMPDNGGVTSRLRRASVSVMQMNPQLGMWQATGTAIAQAPNLTELREPESGGSKIDFDVHGHSARTAVEGQNGGLSLIKSKSKIPTEPVIDTFNRLESPKSADAFSPRLPQRQSLAAQHSSEAKEGWNATIQNGLKAFWKFFLTPTGFCIIIYFLNIVAWGAMLFFLLLKAAPAMNYPAADDDNSPRKIWLEIDSQILNALFCVTGFGLAPWRFKDLYYMIRVVHFHDKAAMSKLYKQNKAWFRPPAWFTSDEDNGQRSSEDPVVGTGVTDRVAVTTFTGELAPPTPMWKLGFNIWMMVLNTVFQIVLSYFMWAYNRLDRPSWATGTFIALGCGVSALAGIMSWWEGRKVKKIEGAQVRIEEKAETC
ncbi:hypothetical protein BJ170DRAFT_678707 [Xylariales sp. AK1849]|nr:hypothetical protein BJ170DRAFT_678707 [Xylariales sp. AK1849]